MDSHTSFTIDTTPAEKPYHSKRPHKKSRTGCRTCKVRKVKCDEGRPACRNCVLRKAACIYPDTPARRNGAAPTTPAPPEISASSHSHSPTPSSNTATAEESSPRCHTPGMGMGTGTGWLMPGGGDYGLVIREPQFRPADVTQTDMKLLWWYTTFTYSSFSTEGGNSGPMDTILKVTIPQKAFETPFLMDMLLALSASHVQFLKQDIEPERVVAYRARAFEGYRKAVAEGRPQTYPALLAGSLILSVIASALFREQETQELYILDWMILWRGIGLIIDLISPKALWESGLAQLFYRPPLDLGASDPHIPDHLTRMVECTPVNDEDYPDIDTYRKTLQYLGTLYLELRNGNGPIMTLKVITWFTFLPKEFIGLARLRRPRALVILAHYLVFAKLLSEVWWTQNIGDREIPNICNYLGPAYYDVLRVPAASVGVSGVVELGRLLFGNRSWVPPGVDLFQQGRDVRTKMLAFVDDSGRPLDYDDEWVFKETGERGEPCWNYDFGATWMSRMPERQRMEDAEGTQDSGSSTM